MERIAVEIIRSVYSLRCILRSPSKIFIYLFALIQWHPDDLMIIIHKITYKKCTLKMDYIDTVNYFQKKILSIEDWGREACLW